MSYAQLRALGLGRGAVESSIKLGRLVWVLPKVYALGHATPSREGDLWAAILYAGPGAALSHATAAHWRGLIDYPPVLIEVSTSREIKSREGIRVYGRRSFERLSHTGLPVTSIEQTALDLAAVAEFKLVRKALARLDFRHELDVAALVATCGRGKPGSKPLRRALELPGLSSSSTAAITTRARLSASATRPMTCCSAAMASPSSATTGTWSTSARARYTTI